MPPINRKQHRADGKAAKLVETAGQQRGGESVDLHALGIEAFRAGHNAKALDLIARAIAINGQMPSFHYNFAIVLKAQGG